MFAGLLLSLLLLSVGAIPPREERPSASTIAQFTQHVKRYGITFNSAEEAEYRLGIFDSNLKKIDLLNRLTEQDSKRRNNGARFGMNKFGLLSADEFKAKYLTLRTTPVDPERVAPLYSSEEMKSIPTQYDWRTLGAVTPVKDQGQCGSCWAFSSTGNMEGQWYLSKNQLVSLSEQNLVDCDHQCLDPNDCDQGCNGGLQPNAYNYVIKNSGIDTETSYPYEGVDGACRFKASSVGVTISNWTFVSKDEGQIATYLVEHGPLAVAVDAEVWQFYVGGVLYIPCGTSLDHGVLIVGYGVETDIVGQNMPFWTIKNSWGPDWGESGYIFIERGNGLCGVNQYVTSSIV